MRNMVEADLERVLEVENTCYSIPWSEMTFRGLLQRRDAEIVVAEIDAAIIGHAVYWYVLDQGELGNVAVVERARGRGVGRLLVGEVVQRAARRGVRELFLEVRPSHESARHLYATHGFEQVGRRRNYYQQPAEDALVLRRTIDLVAPVELEK
jgi:ribosomal-protein-alanine N-acetyltransferase